MNGIYILRPPNTILYKILDITNTIKHDILIITAIATIATAPRQEVTPATAALLARICNYT